MVWKATAALLCLVTALSILESAHLTEEPPCPPRPSDADASAESVRMLHGPRAREEPAPETATETTGTDEAPSVEARIDVAANGSLRFLGTSVGPDRFVVLLARFADGDRDETDQRISRRAIHVVADPMTPWGSVRQALSDCTSPRVRIARLRLTAGVTERVCVDRRLLRPPGRAVRIDRAPRIETRLGVDRRRGIWIQLLDRRLGRGEEARELLGRYLKNIAGSNPELDGELSPGLDVPVRDVVRILGTYRRAGVRRTFLVGVPGRQWEAELLIRCLRRGATNRIEDHVKAMAASPHSFDGGCDLRTYLEGRPEAERAWVVSALLRAAEGEGSPPMVDGEASLTASEEILVVLGSVAAPALGRRARDGSLRALKVLSMMYRSEGAPALEDVLWLAAGPSSEVRRAAVRVLSVIGDAKDARVVRVFEIVESDPQEDRATRDFARGRLRWFRRSR